MPDLSYHINRVVVSVIYIAFTLVSLYIDYHTELEYQMLACCIFWWKCILPIVYFMCILFIINDNYETTSDIP